VRGTDLALQADLTVNDSVFVFKGKVEFKKVGADVGIEVNAGKMANALAAVFEPIDIPADLLNSLLQELAFTKLDAAAVPEITTGEAGAAPARLIVTGAAAVSKAVGEALRPRIGLPVEVRDAATDALLDSRSVTSFTGGKYLVWNVCGHVKIKVTKTGSSNAVVSGLFFGGVAAKTYYETWNVDKAKCRRILIVVKDDSIQADFYWDLLNSGKTIIKENVKTSADLAPQTNAVTYADIKAYVNGKMKDHYKAMKQLYSGADE
jgi:hypothetical protein